MSNHYHAVVETRPEQVAQWSDEEVTTRWMRLCKVPDEDARARRIAATLADPERLTTLRTRLGSLSWFMAYTNEPLDRRDGPQPAARAACPSFGQGHRPGVAPAHQGPAREVSGARSRTVAPGVRGRVWAV